MDCQSLLLCISFLFVMSYLQGVPFREDNVIQGVSVNNIVQGTVSQLERVIARSCACYWFFGIYFELGFPMGHGFFSRFKSSLLAKECQLITWFKVCVSAQQYELLYTLDQKYSRLR